MTVGGGTKARGTWSVEEGGGFLFRATSDVAEEVAGEKLERGGIRGVQARLGRVI
jgi:hypothetical protein